MIDPELLNAWGVPDDCPALQRAMRLHHVTRTGPLPYETALAIVAVLQSIEDAALQLAGDMESASKSDTSKLKGRKTG